MLNDLFISFMSISLPRRVPTSSQLWCQFVKQFVTQASCLARSNHSLALLIDGRLGH
jgi:hypothetical protein